MSVKTDHIISILQKTTSSYTPTLCKSIINEYGKNPFLILISCLLSLRSKGSVTIHVCRDLFKVATTPKQIIDIPTSKLEQIVFKIGFYKNKAKTIKEVSKIILEKYNGKVPSSLPELLSIKGIGRKTANLVLGLAFDTPAICVDIHVHRISNRLGCIKTKTPEETESALRGLLEKKHWIEWNRLLVMHGQNICTPISPFCSKCPISSYCKKVSVSKSR